MPVISQEPPEQETLDSAALLNINDQDLLRDSLHAPESCEEDPQLPGGYAIVYFDQLLAEASSGSREFSLLTGLENGFAGVDMHLIQGGYCMDVGAAFSFCLNGRTYTAVEDQEDGYRSSLGFIIARDGNFCETQFPACALWPSMRLSEDATIFELLIEPGGEAALSVGTDYSEDYYPCFISWHSAEGLQRATDMGVALAIELDEALPAPQSSAAVRRARL